MAISIGRAFDILETIGGSEKGLKHGEIAQLLGIPKSSLTKILRDLLSNEYLEIDADNQKYVIGSRVLTLSRSYLRNLDIVNKAQPIIHETMVNTGESTALLIRRAFEAIVLLKVNSPGILATMINTGDRMPLYATGGGKAILAFFPEEMLEKYLASVDLVGLTSNTITDPEHLKEELEQIKNTGLSICDGEQFEDLLAFSAPIFGLNDRVDNSITVALPRIRKSADKEKAIIKNLKLASLELSKKLGADIPNLKSIFGIDNGEFK